MTPEAIYQNAINQEGFTSDPVQAQAVQLTQQLYELLIEQSQRTYTDNFLERMARHLRQRIPFLSSPAAIRGLYFWGGVGRGKSWLMDSFFNTLPFTEKRRIHFHPFMEEIHEQLKNLPRTPDPLLILARQMAEQYQVLCIDEFHVQDITDAMLLAGLLHALFSYGVVLITTSNIAPDDLYKNGLQRERFLPAIQLIKEHTRVFELNSATDYRDMVLAKEGCFHIPLNAHNEDMMLQHYIKLSNHAPVEAQSIKINKRVINTVAFNQPSKAHPDSVIWFEFDELCNTARSNSDYQRISEMFEHILIANIYPMDEQKDSVAKRFMHLIDALYDNHRCLVLSAEVEPEELYSGRLLKMSFQRTVSRLKEMRSKLYRGESCS